MQRTNVLSKFCLLLALGFAGLCFTSSGDKEGDDDGNGNAATATTDPGVVINGVRWATRNLDTGGKFVANSTDYGALYQWGRRADGHESRTSATTDVPADSDSPGHSSFILSSSAADYDWRSLQNDALWNAGTETAPVKSSNDPSPAGWRVPTKAEFDKLFDDTKVSKAWDAAKKGYTFTDIASGKTVFFPAAGYRGNNGGMVGGAGALGYYWSSSPLGINARYLYFSSSGAGSFGVGRAGGRSLRPVAE